jgi:hypothetical protein
MSHPLKLLELQVPAPLKLAHHHAIFRLHRRVLTLGALRFILRSLNPMRPVEAQRFAAPACLLIGTPRRLRRARLRRFEKHLHYRLVNALAAEDLTVRSALLLTGA